MSDTDKKPSFAEFGQWLASRLNRDGIPAARYEQLSAAAKTARDEYAQARAMSSSGSRSTAAGVFETLQLLAAADKGTGLPPEIVTARGFRISFAYGEGSDANSLGVFVTCPEALCTLLAGQMAYLWRGADRFELGQFDAEGKALGALPADMHVSADDFASGRVKLELPA